ncbi:unnamed protein product [Spirodela intermedia]|uniref:Uncharacterized protein n=1 Tax=Spirodela intermedia TaxID=51605 RepID=A0A7I8IA33_SPIIN|nr:unnamed protein product [Spirodela intermedia]CAA6654314.1 unnamed protein product [Spirodela intermedia]
MKEAMSIYFYVHVRFHALHLSKATNSLCQCNFGLLMRYTLG